jgi:hypothetical protein
MAKLGSMISTTDEMNELPIGAIVEATGFRSFVKTGPTLWMHGRSGKSFSPEQVAHMGLLETGLKITRLGN